MGRWSILVTPPDYGAAKNVAGSVYTRLEGGPHENLCYFPLNNFGIYPASATSHAGTYNPLCIGVNRMTKRAYPGQEWSP